MVLDSLRIMYTPGGENNTPLHVATGKTPRTPGEEVRYTDKAIKCDLEQSPVEYTKLSGQNSLNQCL